MRRNAWRRAIAARSTTGMHRWLGWRAVVLAFMSLVATVVPGLQPTAGALVSGPGSWGPLMDWNGLVAIHMVVGPDGTVLAWDKESGFTSARLWHPDTERFTAAPGLDVALFCAFQTQIPGGRIAVVGGTSPGARATGTDTVHIFDWSSGTWSRGARMHTPRWYPTALELPDGRVLAIGGQQRQKVWAPIPEVYDPATDEWTELPELATSTPFGNYPRALIAPNGLPFFVKTPGSSGGSAYLDVDARRWIPVTTAPGGASTGFLVDIGGGRLLITGAGSSKRDTWTIDLTATNPAWRRSGQLAYARQRFAAVVLPDGSVVAIGGSKDSTHRTTSAQLVPERWDPATGQWSPLASLAVPRMYHSSAVLLPDGRVLSAGGGRVTGAIDYPSAQVYTPPEAAMADRPAVAPETSSWSRGSAVSVTVTAEHGLSSLVLMGRPAATHTMDTQQRRIELPFLDGSRPASGEVRVEVPAAALAPPGGYMLYALDERGVWSHAAMVELP